MSSKILILDQINQILRIKVELKFKLLISKSKLWRYLQIIFSRMADLILFMMQRKYFTWDTNKNVFESLRFSPDTNLLLVYQAKSNFDSPWLRLSFNLSLYS